MDYKDVLEKARGNIGPYCKACAVCNGKACGNSMPGPSYKGPGNGGPPATTTPGRRSS